MRLAMAATRATEFLESSRGDYGAYRLTYWPEVSRKPIRRAARLGRAVTGLRVKQRLELGFLDPIEDAIYLTAGLRFLGFNASLNLGREVAPVLAPAGLFAWVQVGADVLSTSMPVLEEYTLVYQSPEG